MQHLALLTVLLTWCAVAMSWESSRQSLCICNTDFILSTCHIAQAAASKAKIKYKPLIDEEDERRRASAAAKLRALDEAIAKRRAEEER